MSDIEPTNPWIHSPDGMYDSEVEYPSLDALMEDPIMEEAVMFETMLTLDEILSELPVDYTYSQDKYEAVSEKALMHTVEMYDRSPDLIIQRAIELANFKADMKIDFKGSTQDFEYAWNTWTQNDPLGLEQKKQKYITQKELRNNQMRESLYSLLGSLSAEIVFEEFDYKSYFASMPSKEVGYAYEDLLLADITLNRERFNIGKEDALAMTVVTHDADPELTAYRAGILFRFKVHSAQKTDYDMTDIDRRVMFNKRWRREIHSGADQLLSLAYFHNRELPYVPSNSDFKDRDSPNDPDDPDGSLIK